MLLNKTVGDNGLAVPLQTAESVCSLSENAGGTAEYVFSDFVLFYGRSLFILLQILRR